MSTETTIRVELTLDGVARTAEVPSGALLVEALREDFGTTGPKLGCATGDCGACTVRRDGEIVKSCLELAAGAQGCEIVTIEGLADGDELSPVQQAFWDEQAFQCGFCLSGMVFAAEDLLRSNPRPTDDEIRWAISGNLCRCTGYEAIVEAVRTAARRMAPPAG
ncbi:MAG: carbon monoxide dehydrogenase small chain [Solirubrobacterales bacterium]|nr:carbon monoxide dehydrogenase small chain [Solirubrobacterales bacterium]